MDVHAADMQLLHDIGVDQALTGCAGRRGVPWCRCLTRTGAGEDGENDVGLLDGLRRAARGCRPDKASASTRTRSAAVVRSRWRRVTWRVGVFAGVGEEVSSFEIFKGEAEERALPVGLSGWPGYGRDRRSLGSNRGRV